MEQDFASDSQTPQRARRFVEEQLDAVFDSQQRHELTDDARLTVSELVTNAVRAESSLVTVSLELHHGSLQIEVCDDAVGLPVMTEPEPTGAGGRGLAIVDRLAQAWGVVTGIKRKKVWARLAVPPQLTVRLVCATPVPP